LLPMSPYAHIRVLPIHVANKIAAGEVVERPASVVKELVENAIDSGASQVDIEITAGGSKLIAVRDNGSGMNRDDALLSIERQATSKIRDVEDIEKISTLGFRGEALAAIASVSRFRLQTCLKGEIAGTEIAVTGGKVTDVRDAGCPAGTSVEVRDLFFNVPARRKFLRSHETELSHIRAMFIVQALAHSGIGMSLKVDGRETYRLPPDSKLEERVRDLFGPECMKNLAPVNHANAEVAVSGHVSMPTVSRSDRSEQYIFVNGRPTSAPLLNYAINEGYHTLLPNARHPTVFLFLEMDSELVDVNVHPTKKEVRFRHGNEVRDAVIAAIRAALASDKAVAPRQPMMQSAETDRQEARPAAEARLQIENLPPTRAFKYPRMPGVGTGGDSASIPYGRGADTASTPPAQKKADGSPTPSIERSQTSPWSWCRVMGQIGSLYVLLEIEDGFVLMDPHAAHERVLFERFMKDVLNGKIHAQTMLIPETVELGPKDALCVRKNLEVLKQMGFGIAEFGGDAFVVDALPAYFTDSSAHSMLPEIAHGLEQAGARGAKGRWREESIAQSACKAAVKARDKLSLDEIERLVVDLAGTEMPYTCPHGRPTLIFTSFKELNKKFGRE
jgi:DNA mismatch repair protein MutL